MSVNSTTSNNGELITITVNGRFDFSLHQQFREAYSRFNTGKLKFVLNLSNADYMDSSALGMILLLKDHTEMYDGKFVIKDPTEAVNKILKIAQFHRLMTIE